MIERTARLSALGLLIGACNQPVDAIDPAADALALPDAPGRHAAAPWSEAPDGGRRHLRANLTLDLDDRGAHVRRFSGDVSLRTLGVGRGEAVTEPAWSDRVDGPCVDGSGDTDCLRPIARAGAGVTEWWVARTNGVQAA